jgi:hypothetical protein
MDDELLLDHMVSVLNRAIAKDPKAMTRLMNARVPCNDELAQDQTIQVGCRNGGYTIGAIGLLSGIAGCHSDSYSKLEAEFQTVCPIHGVVDADVGQKCPSCSCVVILGDIIRFQKSRGVK